MNRNECNAFRYDGGPRGHYESYFQRANHPSRPLAFWIRYTVFSPKGRPADAVGELWGMFFDGERDVVTAVKEVVPFSRCEFWAHGLRARIADASLDDRGLRGQASALGHTVAWELAYTSPQGPLLLFPERFYVGPIPKAKQLIGSPLARYSGEVTVDGERYVIEDWVGSQSHNWGSQQTDEYGWVQVAGFDNAPNTFLEVARARIGPLRTPWLSPAVLRHDGRDYAFNSLLTSARARGHHSYSALEFRTQNADATLEGRISAPPNLFVGLPYDNPPGGRKTCLNTKLARAEVTLTPRRGAPIRLVTESRAALEILTDNHDHGISVLGV
jgi:hypothetical protein